MVDRKARAFGGVVAVLCALWINPSPARAGLCSQCAGNAATVGDGIVFDELSAREGLTARSADAVNKDGPFIEKVVAHPPGAPVAGIPAHLKVTGDKLSVLDAIDGRELDVVGVIVSLKMRDGRSYDVQLVSTSDQVAFWAAPPGNPPSYVFMVRKTRQRDKPIPRATNPGPHYVDDDRLPTDGFVESLCTTKFDESTMSGKAGVPNAAIVFQGDHYTAKHEVTKQKDGWFNLACLSTAAAKMHLLRHTTASLPRDASFVPTLAQRTAMLRAITADYCGDGRAWTGDGTPLWWTDERHTFPLAVQADVPETGFPLANEIEAVWGTSGKLLCLNEPRRTRTAEGAPDDATCTTPQVKRAEVTRGTKACPGVGRLPKCSEFPWTTSDKHQWSEPLLRPGSSAAVKALAGAYVITVNRRTFTDPTTKTVQKTGDYCNRAPARSISWP